MAVNRLRNPAEPRPVPCVISLEGVDQIAEQPGPALAAAANNHTVDAGLLHHADSIFGTPNVSVAQYRDVRQRLPQFSNGIPVRRAGVELRRGAPMKRYGGNPGVAGNLPGFPER